MKTRIIIFFLLLPMLSFCQKHINQSRDGVMKDLKNYKPGSISPLFTETDSTITMSVKGSDFLPADFIYEFDKYGKCKSEKVIAGCDTCINKWLRATLKMEKYGWRKINENQYVSKFEDRMMIELPPEGVINNYSILRMGWTKVLYDLLTSTK